MRQVPPRTSRDMLMGLLRRKAWQLRDLEHHPACLGVPLGQDGGAAKGVSVDLGLKTMATVSLTDLVDASPHFKQALIERGLTDAQEAKAAELQGAAEGQGAAELQGAEEGGAAGGAAGEAADAEAGGAEARATEPLAYADLMRRAQPVPMLVAVKEDLMKQPIASPIHPAALERSIPESECFFWRAHQPRTCLSPPLPRPHPALTPPPPQASCASSTTTSFAPRRPPPNWSTSLSRRCQAPTGTWRRAKTFGGSSAPPCTPSASPAEARVD